MYSLFIVSLFISCNDVQAQKSALDLLNLDYPGLNEVRKYHSEGKDSLAMLSLLQYYRIRTNIVFPGYQDLGKKISRSKKKVADNGLEHKFQVMSSYKSPFFYGKDINWQYWPVKDYELRWQIHRMPWWNAYARVYAYTKDEKYVREWISEYRDWIKKNPLNDYNPILKGRMLNADNQYFAWRPLETGIRLKSQTLQFFAMRNAKAFTTSFLNDFLLNYHKHMVHLDAFYTKSGNHRVSEAQGMLYASLFFPEFKDSKIFGKKAFSILNEELKKQVLEDGMQYELSPGYHYTTISAYLDVLRMCNLNGFEDTASKELYDRIHSMVQIAKEFIYPDYSFPLFSDNQQKESSALQQSLNKWHKLFPQDSLNPKDSSSAYSASGFYFLKNGWDMSSTIVMIKAGPPAFYHCQPDNGTFEYWRKGRNFFPDSGCYVYSGDDKQKAERDWFRQTKVHNTLTLDGKNLEKTESKLIEFKTNKDSTMLTIVNQSYKELQHIRKFVYYSDGSMIIYDTAYGSAEGIVQINFNLLEGLWKHEGQKIKSLYNDGNNISLSVSSNFPITVKREEGRISRKYKSFVYRPSYSFNVKKKSNQTIEFKTFIKGI